MLNRLRPPGIPPDHIKPETERWPIEQDCPAHSLVEAGGSQSLGKGHSRVGGNGLEAVQRSPQHLRKASEGRAPPFPRRGQRRSPRWLKWTPHQPQRMGSRSVLIHLGSARDTADSRGGDLSHLYCVRPPRGHPSASSPRYGALPTLRPSQTADPGRTLLQLGFGDRRSPTKEMSSLIVLYSQSLKPGCQQGLGSLQMFLGGISACLPLPLGMADIPV